MDSDVRVRELASRSAVVRSAAGSTPVIETVPATGGMGRAYGLMLRWCRIVANHPTRCTTSSGLQAASAASASSNTRLCTPHLLRTGATQQRFHLPRPGRLARHEDAELVVREPGVVGDRPETARRGQAEAQDAGAGGEGAGRGGGRGRGA